MDYLKKKKLFKRVVWAVSVLGLIELALIWKAPIAQWLNDERHENQVVELSQYHSGLSSKITPTRSFLTNYGQDQRTEISFEFKANNKNKLDRKNIGSGLFFSTSDDVSKGITAKISPAGQVLVSTPLDNGQTGHWGSQQNYLDGSWHILKISAWNGHDLSATLDGILLPAERPLFKVSIDYEVGEIKLYPYDFFRNFQAENIQLIKNK